MYWLFYICFSVLFFTFSTSETNLLEELTKVKWFCANENCTEPISEGHSLRPNNPVHPMSWLEVNFNTNDRVLILGKPNNGTQHQLWWLVKAGNKKGVAPVQYLLEDRVIISAINRVETVFDFSSLMLPTETETHFPKEAIKPSPPRTVIDGTSIPPYVEEELAEEIIVDYESEEMPSEPPKLEVIENPASEGIHTTNVKEINEGVTNTAQKINKITTLESTGENSLVGSDNNILADIDNRTIHQNTDNRTIQQNIDNRTINQNVDVENLGNPPGLNIDYASVTTKSQLTEANKFSTVTSGNVEDPGNQSNITEPGLISTESDKGQSDQSNATEPSLITTESGKVAEISRATVLESGNSPSAPKTEALTSSPVSDIPKSSLPVTDDEDVSVKEEVEMAPFLSVTKNETVNMQNETVPNVSAVLDTGLEIVNNETDENKEFVLVDTSHSETDFAKQQTAGSVPNVVSNGSESSPPISTIEHSSQQMAYGHHSDISENDVYGRSVGGISEASSDLRLPPASPAEPEVGKPSDSDLSEDVANTAEATVESSSSELSGPEREVRAPEPSATVLEENVPEILPTSGEVVENNEEETETTPDPVSDNDPVDSTPEEAGFGNWFSEFSSVMSSFKEMFTKSDIGDDKDFSADPSEAPEPVPEKSSVIKQTIDGEMHCDKESLCLQSKDYSQSTDEEEEKGNAFISGMFEGFSGSQMSLSTIVCLVITAVAVLLFSLGHYYLENLKQDSALISKINTLSSELFFAQKELVSIEEHYQQANESYQKLVTETSHNEVSIEKMRQELEQSKAARRDLEDEIKRLEKEIESLVEEGDEMHRMLAESFSEEERTKSLLANISDLKGVLSERLQEIVSLTEQLDKEKQEVELVTIRLKKSEEKQEATEDKLAKVLYDADSKTLAVTKEYEEKISTLERIIEERSLERTNFEKQICELKGTCESLTVGKELAEKELKKAHGVSSGKALNEWLETKQLRADFLAIQKKVDELKKDLEEAKQQGAFLEGREKELLNEIESLNNKYEAAEKEKIEALTKLQVLSNYFKEKEIQLQEELGTKEAQWLQKQSEGHTIYEQMRSLREENLSYKAQNEALKKEILDQETSFKIQIANEEQKAQENWINLRHTERRLKEVQMEAAHLRSRLTALEANPDSLEEKHKSLEMVNGDVTMGAASPPFMLYPPPDFIPPPPLVSPTRPPPLGRLSSPPLTPPAPLSPFDFFPPPPPSPPLPLRVHKPQPRESHRKQKDSQSSNHSSESIEKPVRRGKR